jgi:Ca-activated chloride channel family protein
MIPNVEMDERQRPSGREDGLGALTTERGNLPLERVAAAVRITGLVGRIELTQGFHNPHDVPLEATYIFPLPDRAAVTALTLTAADRTVRAELKERAAARQEYDAAIASGRRAAIAEEERPDVFTMRVGNILPGERVTVALTLVGPLSYEDGEATFRLPLVVAPRYIPGTPLPSTVGDGYAHDTDAVPDASRITPPILLPGFPNPVRLSIDVDIDPAGLPLTAVRSSLHAVRTEGSHLSIEPGERLDRDFILRLSYGDRDATTQALGLTPDVEGDEGTYRLTILPPTAAAPPRPRDVVLVLDRSGSMSGWKMIAARRAASRIVDTLTPADRFAVIAFDDRIEEPSRPGPGLQPGTDQNRYAAVEFLSRMDSRGGTEMLAPLQRACGLLTDPERDRVIVLVTDGQVGNEGQLVAQLSGSLAGIRVHTVGIDRAVNAGFLGRLATLGRGRCELVESEGRLDEAMDHIHRRIGAPVVSGLSLAVEGLTLVPETISPNRLPDLFPGAPLVLSGRYRGLLSAGAALTVTGRTRTGEAWSARVTGATVRDESVTAVWARGHLRDLEDRFASQPYGMDPEGLQSRIVGVSLRRGVLCRFTAWVAIDERVVTEGGQPHRVVQPVELPSGWEMPVVGAQMMLAGMAAPMAPQGRAMAVGGRMMARRAPAAAVPSTSVPAAEQESLQPLSLLAAVAADEARALRAASGAAEYERRDLLADLGTRLAALAGELGTGPQAQAVRSLIEELAEQRLASVSGGALDALWDRALALLDALAGSSGSAGPRAEFWKQT